MTTFDSQVEEEDSAAECEHVPLIAEERTEARRRRRSTLVEQGRTARFSSVLHFVASWNLQGDPSAHGSELG